jgi:hypothetical protein
LHKMVELIFVPLHQKSWVRLSSGEETMNPIQKKPAQEDSLANDLLRGADEIANYLFGEAVHRRKVYYLAETSRFPVFRLGARLCARRSVLKDWISSQEKRGCQSAGG